MYNTNENLTRFKLQHEHPEKSVRIYCVKSDECSISKMFGESVTQHGVIYGKDPYVKKHIKDEILYWQNGKMAEEIEKYEEDGDTGFDAEAYPFQLIHGSVFVNVDERYEGCPPEFDEEDDLTDEEKLKIGLDKDDIAKWMVDDKLKNYAIENGLVNNVRADGKVAMVILSPSDDEKILLCRHGLINIKNLDLFVNTNNLDLKEDDYIALKISYEDSVFPISMYVDVDDEDCSDDGYAEDNYGVCDSVDDGKDFVNDKKGAFLLIKVKDILNSPSKGKDIYISCLHCIIEDYGYYY